MQAFPPQPPRGPNGSPRGPPGRPSPPPSSSSSGPGKKPGGGLIIPGMEDFPTDVIPGMSPGGYAAGGGGKQGQTISMPGSQPGQQQFGRRPQTPPAGKEYDEESGALNPDTPMGGVKVGTSNAGGGGPRPTYLAPGEEMTGSFEQQFKPPPTFDDGSCAAAPPPPANIIAAACAVSRLAEGPSESELSNPLKVCGVKSPAKIPLYPPPPPPL